ncbi:MAG TPA: PAS domain S-box protein, partial [Candidatus Sabulitectum sp.]|nr:PAS domain S-box protein [Candidatus Sabulitectum sp.]
MSTFRNTEGKTVHENLMNLLDQAGVCVLIAAGENGRIVSTNKAALKFLETGPDDVSGEPAEEVLKKVHEGGITVDRTLVEENGVLYQVFSFRMSSGGLTDFERVIRDLDDVYFKTTLDGKILAASPSVENFSGYRPEEVLGRPITSFYRNPDDRGVLLEKLREKGRLSEYQVEMLGRNGRVIHARGAIHLVYDDEGEPAFIEGILTDITARKKLEDRIRNDSLFFNQVLESVPDAVVIIDRNGIVTGWNPEAARLFGWTSEEAIGRPLDDLVYTGSGRNEIQSMDVINGKVIRGLECTRRGKDPVEKKVFVSVAPIVMDDESAGAVGIYTDLSDRESILEKLRENEVKFRSITDSAQDAVIIMDENGCVSFFNSSAERMFGYHRTETMGRQLHEMISPEAYWEMFDMGFAEFRRTGKGIVIGRVMEMEG